MLYHLTNVGPQAEWKIEKVWEKFPNLPLVYRNYPMTMQEAGWPDSNESGYDEGVAIMNGLHSMGFERELTDQESFEVWSFWFGLKK